MSGESWVRAVEYAYRLGVKECQEGIDHCFNPYITDVNTERRDAWWKGWMEEHNGGTEAVGATSPT